MAGNVKVQLPDGKIVDGVQVDIEESIERWCDIKLRDGTELRVKMTVISVARAEGEFDAQGNPYYSLNITPVIAVASAPAQLKKKTN